MDKDMFIFILDVIIACSIGYAISIYLIFLIFEFLLY